MHCHGNIASTNILYAYQPAYIKSHCHIIWNCQGCLHELHGNTWHARLCMGVVSFAYAYRIVWYVPYAYSAAMVADEKASDQLQILLHVQYTIACRNRHFRPDTLKRQKKLRMETSEFQLS